MLLVTCAMAWKDRLVRWMSSPRMAMVNAVLVGGAVLANMQFQVFCRPVPWAWMILLISIVPVIIYPRFKHRMKSSRSLLYFLFGIAACICVYCILFLGKALLIFPLAIFLNPFSILGFVPYFLLAQIFYHTYTTADSIKPFVSGVLLCVAFSIGMAIWFDHHFDHVTTALKDPAEAPAVPANYMTELMLGMHVKYHLSFCGYDGWRPPLHDPSVVVAAWLNSPFHDDPYRKRYRGDLVCPAPIFLGNADLKDRIKVYESVFPENMIWLDCSCARAYSHMYYDDPRRIDAIGSD
jgi:hypothetical protein